MELCRQLSYEGSIRPGKAVFFYKTPGSDFEPLEVEISKIRGQKCAFAEAYSSDGSPKNLQPQDLAYSNPIIIESCYVPPTVNELFCRFSLRIHAHSLAPSCCDSPEVFACLTGLAQRYADLKGYQYLARRYCKNLLMGSWLWRNQYARDLEVEVLSASGKGYKVENLHRLDWNSEWPKRESGLLAELAEEVAVSLVSPRAYGFFDVTARIATEFCQEVMPSQLFTEKAPRGEASRQFMKVACPDGRKAAGLTSGKVGAALQMIDDWWGEDVDRCLRVHEYGADRKFVIAQRTPERGNDFYSLLRDADNLLASLHGFTNAQAIPANVHYLMAMLIKAGMFQRSGAVE